MNNRNVYNEIRVLQVKLNQSIEKNGLSNKKTIELSKRIDELVNYYYLTTKIRNYPQNNNMMYFYEISYSELKRWTIENNRFPEVEEWNAYAKKNYLLSTESIKYISMLDWKYLRVKVNREINMKIF